MNTQKYTIERLAQYIPNKAALYRNMIKKGFYLPNESSKVISEEYLLSCTTDKVFSMKISQLKPFLLVSDISYSCTKIVEEIQKKVQKPFGFTPTNLPDKAWLFNVLHSLDSDIKFLKVQLRKSFVIYLRGKDLIFNE